MSENRKPTMVQIARELGVTQATVSMALRNHPGISVATKERVQEAARKMGYRPDPLVSALMAQRRGRGSTGSLGTLGVVSFWPESSHYFFTRPYFQPTRDGIERRAGELGFSLDNFPCDGSPPDAKRLLRVLRARGIQGLIFAQSHVSISAIPIPLGEFSAASIGNTLHTPVLSRVEPNRFLEMTIVCGKLLEQGHQRIGFFYVHTSRIVSEGIYLGSYYCAMDRVSARKRIPPLTIDDPDDLRPVEAWMLKHKLDAVISERGDTLLALKKRHPGVRMVGLTLDHTRDMDGIVIARQEIGAAVVDMVVAQLHRGDRGPPAIPKTVQILGRWSEHDSSNRR